MRAATKGNGLAKFSELAGAGEPGKLGKRGKQRAELAKTCMGHLGGPQADGALLCKHVAGFENQTTDAILEAFNALPDNNRLKDVRERKCRLLAPFLGLSYADVANLGFKVGRDLWSSAKTEAVRGPESDICDSRHGLRPHAVADGAAQTMWQGASYEGSSGGRSRAYGRSSR